METRWKVDEVGSGFLELKSCRLLENLQRNKGEQGFVCIQTNPVELILSRPTRSILFFCVLTFVLLVKTLPI